MGYSGQPMKVIKANRALLKKSKNFRELRKDYLNYSQETKLHFKELTDVERKIVRDKIRAQAKKDSLQEIGIYILSITIVLGAFYAIFYFG
ncbi:hypothetical protein A9200_07050 [Maribacter hydrothermalis]|uniref:Uncharacterized protein n=2 Tax=Maribacter hydrothermalis TaxID=1836467 RepID=A0A1B7Z3W6_9FLAO|nr:hypothetical protein [Maribacter hydrothermalis]APQ17142.1 hypothetical protein BTR34_07300 [Maribacter hydrothermalis]OBR37403.1 hypothetical protein A9200_07050 [Maribacter hydrothermalis]